MSFFVNKRVFFSEPNKSANFIAFLNVSEQQMINPLPTGGRYTYPLTFACLQPRRKEIFSIGFRVWLPFIVSHWNLEQINSQLAIFALCFERKVKRDRKFMIFLLPPLTLSLPRVFKYLSSQFSDSPLRSSISITNPFVKTDRKNLFYFSR